MRERVRERERENPTNFARSIEKKYWRGESRRDERQEFSWKKSSVVVHAPLLFRIA